MAKKVLILVGTKKGAFIIESDAERRSWELRGPFCETWPMNHVVADPVTYTIYGGGGNEWFGPAVWKSTDLGATWTHSSEGLAYEAGEDPIKSVWSVAPAARSLYAGVEPAGLLRSNDGGQSWQHVAGLRNHPSRPEWQWYLQQYLAWGWQARCRAVTSRSQFTGSSKRCCSTRRAFGNARHQIAGGSDCGERQ